MSADPRITYELGCVSFFIGGVPFGGERRPPQDVATIQLDDEGCASLRRHLDERLSAGGLAVPPGGDS